MIVFKLRMVSDENDHFVRDYEVDAKMALTELHAFLIQSLDYEECITSFFSADDQWEKLCEYTLIDMGDEQTRSMEGVALCDIMLHVGDGVIFQFDQFAARSYFITLTDVAKEEAGVEYPREGFEHGTAPDQYDADAQNNDNSIFDDMMDEFGSFDDDGGYDDTEW